MNHLCDTADILKDRFQPTTQGAFMQQAINTYKFIRAQQQLRPSDACTDAAQLHGVTVAALAAELIKLNIDAARLSLI
jgi:hypothetical protein